MTCSRLCLRFPPASRFTAPIFEISKFHQLTADYLEEAFAQAGRRQPSLGEIPPNFLRKVLLLEFPPGLPEDQKKHWLRFVCRWQQFTGPIMAKGLEDTAAYIYNPLVSLNEVGGYRGAVKLKAFHSFNADRQRLWPATMNTTSTHDTKRSEDVRARLNVLTEMPAGLAPASRQLACHQYHQKKEPSRR